MAVIDVATMEVVERIATADRPHPGSGAIWTAHGTWYGATTYAGEGKVAVWDLSTNVMEGVVETTGPGLFIRAAENSPYVWADALDGLRERLDGERGSRVRRDYAREGGRGERGYDADGYLLRGAQT